MNVVINGEPQTIDEETLFQLCQRFNDHPDFIATAVNGEFVTVKERADCQLKEGDKIEIVSPRQGG